MSPALVGSWQPLIESVAARLLEASVWGAALALGVWALCALVPDLPAVWRRWLWWSRGSWPAATARGRSR